MRYSLVAACLSVCAPASANGAVYVLEGVGTVSRQQTSFTSKFDWKPITDGKIAVGDDFRFTATFDLGGAELQDIFDADPAINIYYIPNVTVSYAIGSYARTFSRASSLGASVQLWNDQASGSTPTDSQSWSFNNYDFKGNVPFDIDGRFNYESFSLNSFDWSGTARTNDLISQLVTSQSAFNANSMSYIYLTSSGPLDSANQQAVIVDTNNIRWTLTALNAVPEPATWIMMIVGFGAIGYTLRRRTTVLPIA